ncbi:NAD-P-binding protein [Flagelloscypha sp. PMI_526]|nr:NAD-P-binding protein [Flagelloscypha sp. PMI_526]
MSKPRVLVCGGLPLYARGLALLLVPSEGEPLVSHLRIVDKYSVNPPTTYLGSEFSALLKKTDIVEYKQANLTIPSIVTSIFEPSEGQEPYDYVFDNTGDSRSDRSDEIQINSTCNVARYLGQEAARRKVKAYIRLSGPHYDTGKTLKTEKDDVDPEGLIGQWWHETQRILAAIPDLNLVILRPCWVYGPYTPSLITTNLIVASVYGYMQKPMKGLHGPGKHAYNTIHIEDIAGVTWAAAKWMEGLGRAKADEVAGEVIRFRHEKDKVRDVEGSPSPDVKLVAPVFHVADDSNATLVSVASTACAFFGTKFEFFNTMEKVALKMSKDIVEEINESHVGAWTEMITKSNPPVPNTPLTAYMDSRALAKHVLGLDNTKMKNVLNYQIKRPALDESTIRETVEKWKTEGTWPVLA